MNQKELLYFVGSCLALDEHPEYKKTVISKFASGEVNIDDFILLCSNHLVLPAIYIIFNKYNLLSVFPNDYKYHIAAIYLQNKKRNLDILKQIDEISNKLNLENINPIYLKGTGSLLDNVYGDISERMIGDIDLLVQDKDYLKAAELITELGYNTDETIYSDVITLKHYPRLYKEDVPADIEIHRIPVNFAYTK